jgi:hypothetical protein
MQTHTNKAKKASKRCKNAPGQGEWLLQPNSDVETLVIYGFLVFDMHGLGALFGLLCGGFFEHLLSIFLTLLLILVG